MCCLVLVLFALCCYVLFGVLLFSVIVCVFVLNLCCFGVLLVLFVCCGFVRFLFIQTTHCYILCVLTNISG